MGYSTKKRYRAFIVVSLPLWTFKNRQAATNKVQPILRALRRYINLNKPVWGIEGKFDVYLQSLEEEE